MTCPAVTSGRNIRYFTDVLGAELIFAIEAMGTRVAMLELPMGPASSFSAPGGHRVALYESTRPGVVEQFAADTTSRGNWRARQESDAH